MIAFTCVNGPYGWLGNMSPHPIEHERRTWRTAEALFQAMRFESEGVRAAIWLQRTPMAAKLMAKRFAEWRTVEPMSPEDLRNMLTVLRLKVAEHPEMARQLIDTGDEEIVEDVTRRPQGRNLFLGRDAGMRKLRLLGCGCCRRIEAQMHEEWSGTSEAVERFIEGTLRDEDQLHLGYATALGWDDACVRALAHLSMLPGENDHGVLPEVTTAMRVCENASGGMGQVAFNAELDRVGDYSPTMQSAREKAARAEAAVQATFVRDIFGNPFRPVTLDPRWLTSTVAQIARGVYEERSIPGGELDTARLAVLADALEDAGCADEQVLAHCRCPGPHVRGCWVVDLLLGKE